MPIGFVVAGLEDPIFLPPSHLNTWRGIHDHTFCALWHSLPVPAQTRYPHSHFNAEEHEGRQDKKLVYVVYA